MKRIIVNNYISNQNEFKQSKPSKKKYDQSNKLKQVQPLSIRDQLIQATKVLIDQQSILVDRDLNAVMNIGRCTLNQLNDLDQQPEDLQLPTTKGNEVKKYVLQFVSMKIFNKSTNLLSI